MSTVSYKVEPKENIYFVIKIVVSVIFFVTAIISLVVALALSARELSSVLFPLLWYAIFLAVFFFLRHGFFVGWIRGNAIRVSPTQFPDIYELVCRQSQMLGLEAVPAVYVMQSGGALNAFATKFLGVGYVVIYSEILEEAYNNGSDTVEFVIAHELGHILHNHGLKRLLTFPSAVVPFLNKAYSRACEYTCDQVGAAISPRGAVNGLVLLAAGKNLRARVNVASYVQQDANEVSFWAWFAEKMSSHPRLPRRVARFQNLSVFTRKPVAETATYEPKVTVNNQSAEPESKPEVRSEDDYSRFMPK